MYEMKGKQAGKVPGYRLDAIRYTLGKEYFVVYDVQANSWMMLVSHSPDKPMEQLPIVKEHKFNWERRAKLFRELDLHAVEMFFIQDRREKRPNNEPNTTNNAA